MKPPELALETMRVFVSYSHKDKGFVRYFSRALTKFGIEVWLDEHEFELGEVLRERLSWAINNCGYVIVVISGSSVLSSWVHYELETVISREQREQRACLIPVLFQGDTIPGLIAGRIIADFRTRDGMEQGFRRIIRAVSRSRLDQDAPGQFQIIGEGTVDKPYSHEELWESGIDRSMRKCPHCNTEYARLLLSDGGGIQCAHCGSNFF